MQDKINADLKTAMLAGEKDKVETLKMIKSAMQMAAIDTKGEFTDEAAIKVLQKEAKKRSEAAQLYKDAGDEGRAAKEEAEVEIIDVYLPEQMSEDEISKIVDEVLSGMDSPDMGKVMGQAMAKVAGKADGGTVSRIVKEKLGE